jgi:hypothetical protein
MQELLAFSVLGVIAGLLGSGFVALHRLILLHKRERYAYTGAQPAQRCTQTSLLPQDFRGWSAVDSCCAVPCRAVPCRAVLCCELIARSCV